MTLTPKKRDELALKQTKSKLLPISTQDVLAGLNPQKTIQWEVAHGNGDLIKALDILGIAGPMAILTPWELKDTDGRHLINAGGYAALPFGEKYPPLVQFIKDYLDHSLSVSLPQQSATDWRAALESNLIALLAAQAPSHQDSQVFFSNSGAGAVEAAIKFVKAARPKAKHFINFRGGYHGKTVGALSLTPNEEYQAPFRPLMPNVVTLPFGDSDALIKEVLHLGPDNVTGIILEPIQGEGGVITPPLDFLPEVDALCKKHGIITIADEVQTGLGRSGHWFASLAAGLEPDIITLAKPLGGGMVPVGATIARKWIVKKALGGLESKRHSNTFGGGSLAMAVGLKSLELIAEENLVERSRTFGEKGLARLYELKKNYPHFVKEVRGEGMLFALQLQPVLNPRLLPGQAELVRQLGTALALRTLHMSGVHACYTLNSNRIVRLTPALNMPEDIFAEMFNRVEQAASKHPRAWQMLPKTPINSLLSLAKLALRP